MTDKEIQDLIRKINMVHQDLVIAVREIQDLSERVERLENKFTRLLNQTSEEASPPIEEG